MTDTSNRAFTLIELSIVIIVIGLIVAGITAGQSMIRQANLRNLVTDYQSFDTAITNFYGQYDAMPGDIANAYDYFGPSCGDNDTSVTGCNGNGNREIALNAANTEVYKAIEHLAYADLITGEFTGEGAGDGSVAVAGVNTPKAAFGGCWTIQNVNNPFGYNDVRNHFWEVGIASGTSTCSDPLPVSAREIANVDRKLDEGTPDLGIVVAGSGNCVQGAYPSVTYDVNNESQGCVMLFKTSMK